MPTMLSSDWGTINSAKKGEPGKLQVKVTFHQSLDR